MPQLSPPIHLEVDEINLLHDLVENALTELPLRFPSDLSDAERWARLNSLRTMFAELRYGMD